MHLCSTVYRATNEILVFLKRTQNIIVIKQCNRSLMKHMLTVIDHCQLETVFIKFPLCHFKCSTYFKNEAVFQHRYATPGGNFEI